MTKDEYINWIKTRSEDPAEWELGKCHQADKHIKIETLKSFRVYLEEKDLPQSLLEWSLLMADVHFGSAETDYLMCDLNCYPDYMEIWNKSTD